MKRKRIATLWLDGCSGCHMSLLDMDERLLELAAKVDIVFSPLVDAKVFPEDVDVACIEGAVGTEEDERRLLTARRRSGCLIALGDCAVTGNVPAMRNVYNADEVLRSVYLEHEAVHARIPSLELPKLHDRALPLHHFVKVDIFIPGCPPAAGLLFNVLNDLAEGREPRLQQTPRFGS